MGIEKAIQQDYGLARGLYTYQGDAIRNVVAKKLGIKVKPLKDIIQAGGKK